MKRVARSLAVLLALLVAVPAAFASSLPAAKPEQVGLSTERLDRIGRALRGDVERGRIAGAVVLVARSLSSGGSRENH